MSEIQNPSNPYRTTPEASAASPAGFWRRLAAYILDGILIGIVAEVIEHIVKLGISDATPSGRLFLISGITVIVGIIYFTALWTARNGQSLGYQALGIRLIKADGSNPGVGANFLRSIVLYISIYLCLIPAIVSAFMVGLGSSKRAIHDLAAGTAVVRT